VNDDESKPLNVVLYMRVSTDEQAKEGFSLDGQLNRLRNYCKARDWAIVGEYIDDGYTGRNTRRPKYQEMMANIDKWDGVVCIKGDRMHRNTKNFIEMQDLLNKKGKDYISITESYDTTSAVGRLVMRIIADIAQYESEQIGERVFDGQSEKARQGNSFMGHRVAFGYKWDGDKKKFKNDHKKLDLVKQVFQMYEDGFSMREIGRKVGKANTTVKYYIHNPMYCGVERWCNYFWNVTELGVDPIISIKTFNKIQRIIRERCKSHGSYDPMIIKDVKSYKLDLKIIKNIPIINRAKHNLGF